MSADVPMPEGRWIDVEGIRTRYYEAGAGEPIVFIYGGNFGTSESASSAYTWNLNLAPLATRFRVIAFDKLGQGETDNPRNDEYTMQAVVNHAAAFLRTLGLGPVHIVGHSRGAYAAMRLTLQHHDLGRSVTIINTGTLSPGVGTNDGSVRHISHRAGHDNVLELRERHQDAPVAHPHHHRLFRLHLLGPQERIHRAGGRYRERLDPALVRHQARLPAHL